MRIAQVAPLYESVPPHYYGGTERVVSWLTEELVRLGHEVSLYASGDSRTTARLVSVIPASLRLGGEGWPDPVVPHLTMLERVARDAHRHDIIHFHTDNLHLPLARRMRTPTVSTYHGRLDRPDLPQLYREYADLPAISISDAQREPIPWMNWTGTIHHGLPRDLFAPRLRQGAYLAFLGRVSPEKGLDQAIAIARGTGIPLRVAAKIDEADREYFEQHLAPLLTHSLVEYVGEITEAQKNDFLGDALAVLFPIDWPEPFGIVMIEAMACGTPIIAFPGGSVAEVIADGVNGFVVNDVDSAIRAVERIGQLSRLGIRHEFEARFTAERMATEHVALYERVLRRARQPVERPNRVTIGSGVADSSVMHPAEDESPHDPASRVRREPSGAI